MGNKDSANGWHGALGGALLALVVPWCWVVGLSSVVLPGLGMENGVAAVVVAIVGMSLARERGSSHGRLLGAALLATSVAYGVVGVAQAVAPSLFQVALPEGKFPPQEAGVGLPVARFVVCVSIVAVPMLVMARVACNEALTCRVAGGAGLVIAAISNAVSAVQFGVDSWPEMVFAQKHWLWPGPLAGVLAVVCAIPSAGRQAGMGGRKTEGPPCG